MLLLASASAATLAVLPIDGRGVSAEAAEAATEALRDALAATGKVEVPRGTALGAALTAGHEDDLRRAREKSAEGRGLLAKGDSRAAVVALDEAARLHLACGSGWARRSELGDVAWALADAHLRLGDTLAARDDLGALAHFWPGYARSRGSASGTAGKMLGEIEVALAREEWAPPADDQVALLRGTLGADWLVVGVLDQTGAVELRVFSEEDAEAVSARVALPIDDLSDDWSDLAEQVVGLLLVPGAPAATSRPAAPERPERPEPVVPVEPDPPPRAAVVADDRPVKIRQTGGIRYDDGPITGRWWFWVALVGVVGTGTAVGIAATQPAPVTTVHEEPTWTLTVVPQ